ncbi:2-oxoglutarate dehydrogenase, E2 component, dihydrolipoamide succinyltransferase, partial [Streptomyces sp. ME02-6978a]|uniref:biotin/lipoyl-containing protein n=1 Tax=Streptomyces sp. ME02-6978a TaxID=3028672 RepID=UPI0029BCC5BD
MAVSVTLPALGESVTEGTVTRWLKAEGERVEADEPLLEVSTDKVDTEIPSPAAGVLSSIKVAEDETVDPGVLRAARQEGPQLRCDRADFLDDLDDVPGGGLDLAAHQREEIRIARGQLVMSGGAVGPPAEGGVPLLGRLAVEQA